MNDVEFPSECQKTSQDFDELFLSPGISFIRASSDIEL